MGFWVFKSKGMYLSHGILCLYLTSSRSRFNATYNVAEENYENLKNIFHFKIKHPQYIEALRAFEEVSHENMLEYALTNIRETVSFLIRILPLLVLPLLIFHSEWQFYVIGLILCFMMSVANRILKVFWIKGYWSLMAINIVEQAHYYRFNKSIHEL